MSDIKVRNSSTNFHADNNKMMAANYNGSSNSSGFKDMVNDFKGAESDAKPKEMPPKKSTNMPDKPAKHDKEQTKVAKVDDKIGDHDIEESAKINLSELELSQIGENLSTPDVSFGDLAEELSLSAALEVEAEIEAQELNIEVLNISEIVEESLVKEESLDIEDENMLEEAESIDDDMIAPLYIPNSPNEPSNIRLEAVASEISMELTTHDVAEHVIDHADELSQSTAIDLKSIEDFEAANFDSKAMDLQEDENIDNKIEIEFSELQESLDNYTVQEAKIANENILNTHNMLDNLASMSSNHSNNAEIDVPTPVSSANWSKDVANKMQVLLKANQNIQSAKINLNPSELGPIEVKIKIDDEKLELQFDANNQHTKQMLENKSTEIVQSLNNDNNFLDVNINFSWQGDQTGDSNLADKNKNTSTDFTSTAADSDDISESDEKEHSNSMSSLNIIDIKV